MSYIGKNPKSNTSTLVPQSAAPSNPTEGMIYYDNGTTNTEGVYKYQNAVWEFIGSLVDHLKLNPLNADPGSPVEGQIFYSDGTPRSEGLWVYKNGDWTPVGESSGSLDIFFQENFVVNESADFSTGNNATFLVAGTLDGTLANETSSPIAGSRSLKYTMSTASANDWVASPVIDIDDKQSGNDSVFTLYYTYDGDDDDIRFVLYDVTNSVEFATSVEFFKSKTNPQRMAVAASIPASATQIRWGFQVSTGNNTKILIVDDIEGSLDPFTEQGLLDSQKIHVHTSNGFGSTGTLIRRFSTIVEDVGDSIIQYTDDATNGAEFKALRDCIATFSYTDNFSGASNLGLSLNSTQLSTGVQSITTADRLGMDGTTGANNPGSLSVRLKLSKDDVVRPHVSAATSGNTARTAMVVSAQAERQDIITPVKTNLTNWISYTPTFTGFGTVTNIDFRYKRIGDSIMIQGSCNAGTPTATEARVSLPSGMTSASEYSTIEIVGQAGRDVTSAGIVYTIIEPSTTYVTFSRQDASRSVFTKQNGDVVSITSQEFSFNAVVNIEELDSEATFLAALPMDSDWQTYTPTFSAGFGTAANIEFAYYRVGKMLHIQGKWTNGTVAASVASISLPAGFETASSTIIPNLRSTGRGVRHVASGTNDINVLVESASTDMFFGSVNDGSNAPHTKQNGNAIFSSSQDNSITVVVPIA